MATDNIIRFTILGCGSSGGVPRIGNRWGACDPSNPKNWRRRCSLLIEKIIGDHQTTILIDTGPDVRAQLLDANVVDLDAVLYTHSHADHVHGIDELRVVALNRGTRIPVYLDNATSRRLHQAFGYCFTKPLGSGYPPILIEHQIVGGKTIVISGAGDDIIVKAIRQIHGDIDSLGFRIGNVAYSCDINAIPAQSIEAFQELDVWIVDCLRALPHETHFHLEETLAWIKRLKPKRAILTNLHIDLDYEQLKAKLPGNVEPAYDGLWFNG